VFALATNPAMTAKHLESEPDDRPKNGPRFTYPSGSRPLDGYTIKRGVGRGGFGEVYYAVSDAGKEVALKLIRRNLDVELRGVTHCLNLKHPNLVALYDIKTDENDDRWVVMEYVSGESLEDAINRHPQGMPAELAIEWFSGIAAGVGYLHDHGIVHRDLKPANIFLDEGTVKIGDYGLSKFISCSRRSGQTESVGTVHYMAPEIANGRYGKEIDTYALGIILYEMLTGHVPFEGESVGEVLMKHLTAEPDLNALNEPYREIVRGAMAKDPETRIRNVAEMLTSMGVGTPESVMGNVYTSRVRIDEEDLKPHVEDNGNAAHPWPMFSQETTDWSYEDPVAAGIKQACRAMKDLYLEIPLPQFVKVIILFFVGISLVRTLPAWTPFLLTTAAVYFVYRVIWTVIVQPSRPRQGNKYHRGPTYPPRQNPAPMMTLASSPAAPVTPPEPPVAKKEAKRRRKLSWQRQLREHLEAKPMEQRLTELAGSMLLAAVISSVAALVICLIASEPFSTPLFAWLASAVTLSCWAIMIPAKLLEGRVEDQAPMRFMQLVLGAIVGVMAYSIANSLMLDLGSFNRWGGINPTDSFMSNTIGLVPFGPNQNGHEVHHLSTQVFAAYFAFLFVLVAWWEQADPIRSIRVNIWTMVWCGLIAWLLHFIWWFPQPIGFLVAASISLGLQFSSTWISPSRRRAIAEQEVA
jgi:serine/threonine protein kinase